MKDLHAKINSIWQCLNNCFVKEDGVQPRSLDVLQFSGSLKFIIFLKFTCVFSYLDCLTQKIFNTITKYPFLKSNGFYVIFDWKESKSFIFRTPYELIIRISKTHNFHNNVLFPVYKGNGATQSCILRHICVLKRDIVLTD